MPTQSSSLIAMLRDYWPILVGSSIPALVLGGLATVRRLRYRRWLRKVLDAYDIHRSPVTVYGQDRELLERALGERKLEVTADYPGCWEVVRPRLGPARGQR